MSILEQLRNQRYGGGILRYDSLVRNNIPKKEIVKTEIITSRMEDIKEINETKEKLKEEVIKSQINKKKVMNNPEKLKGEVDNNVILNSSLSSLIGGFLTTKQKTNYIKMNKDNFKRLRGEEQKQLLNIYITYL